MRLDIGLVFKRIYLQGIGIACCLCFFSLQAEFFLTKEPIDVVIPAHVKDKETLEICIQSLHNYAKNIGKIFVVSAFPLTEKAEWVSEAIFPFSKEDVLVYLAQEVGLKREECLQVLDGRLGWIYQQLLKLYAPLVIPSISSNVLVVDADVLFLQPIEFIDERGYPYFAPNKDVLEFPWIVHMKRFLHPLPIPFPSFSGVSHHMLFQKAFLQELFAFVEKENGRELWKAMLHHVDKNHLANCFSEYEIYSNFTCFFLRNQLGVNPSIRDLKWKNLAIVDPTDPLLWEKYRRKGYNYLAMHAFLREEYLKKGKTLPVKDWEDEE